MKTIIYTADDDVKSFIMESAGRYSLYSNILALKDYIMGVDENLPMDENLLIILDYDMEDDRETYDDVVELSAKNKRVFCTFMAGQDSLKEFKDHQNGKSRADSYLFKPLSSESVEQVIDDLELDTQTSTNIDINADSDATVIDLSFTGLSAPRAEPEASPELASDLSLDEDQEGDELSLESGDGEEVGDNTEVRNVLEKHNEDAPELESSLVNQEIQQIFDHTLSGRESSGSGLLEDIEAIDETPQEGELELPSDPSLSLSLDEGELHDDLSVGHEQDALEESSADIDTTGLSLGGEEDLAAESVDGDDHNDETATATAPASDDLEFPSLEPAAEFAVAEEIQEKVQDEDSGVTFDIPITSEPTAPVQEDELAADDSIFDFPTEAVKEIQEIEDNTTTAFDLSAEPDEDESDETAEILPSSSEETLASAASAKEQTKEVHKEEPVPHYSINHMPENEALRLQATIKELREEREKLLGDINKLKQDMAISSQDILGLRAELDEVKIENSIIKKRHRSEIDDLTYRLKISVDKKEYAEEKNKHLEREFSHLEQRVRIDVNQIQQREKELEGQLELVKLDSESQVQTRDRKILELKRKIDQLEFNMENAAIREQKSREDKVHLEDRLDKIMRTLRGSIEVLEEDMNWTEKDK